MATTLKDVLGSDKHEEWVRYFVFPSPGGNQNQNQGPEEDKDELFRLNAACQGLIGEYIWHNEPFVLKRGISPLSSFDEDEDDDNPEQNRQECTKIPYFYGVTHFGDNLEDEWFIVYILRELSKMFPDVVVKVEDNDGEFLLIEAADHLPDWAESDESCKNRVYIHQGKVHLIPEELTPNCSTDNGLKVPQAVELLRESPLSKTIANEGIQQVIGTRVGNYPQKMGENFHHVAIMLPPFLAAILNQKPSLVSAGALAFYLRDPISLKATRLMKMSKAADGLVKSRVRFTKCLYAMLMKQDFRPDKRSGWSLPPPTSSDYKAYSLGAKLATGFEILLEQVGNNSDSTSNGGLNHDAQDSSWLRYEEALKKTGYFQGYMEGSKPYRDLLSGAKDFFKTNLQNVEDAPPSVVSWKDAVCREIKHLAETVQADAEKLRIDSETLAEDDDDSWLAIKPEDLESLLEAKFQTGGLNPDDIPSKLKEFMNKISDFSGVEPSDGGTHRSNSSSSTGTGSPRENGAAGDTQQMDGFGEKFDFKADEFVSAMDKLLHDLGAPDKDFAASDDSYGSDEDEFNVDLESIRKMHTFSKESQEFFGMMGQMDKELASTTMGQTFKPSKPVAPSSASASGQTSVPSSSTSKSKVATASVEELDEFDEEGLTPVNIDMNALANILESFQSQDGPSGPSANLLRSVGFDMNRVKK